MRKNLISSPLLSDKVFLIVFESNKFLVIKRGAYEGKDYLFEGHFKLPIVNTINDDVNINKMASSNVASTYMVNSSNLWHAWLGHVNFRSTQRMMNLGMLPNCSINKMKKCDNCVESKFSSHSHKSIEKTNQRLWIVSILALPRIVQPLDSWYTSPK